MDWGLIGLITTVVFGIVAIVSIIVAYRLARKKEPVWAHRTTRIVGLGTDAPQDLKLTYGEKQVKAVYQTVLVFYNEGNEAIREADVTDAVVFQFKGGEILSEPIFTPNKPQTRMSLKRLTSSENAIKLDFSYLGHNDGAMIEILHTHCDAIECAGNFIDSKEIKNIGSLPWSYPRLRNFMVLLIIGAMAAAVVTAIIGGVLSEEGFSEGKVSFVAVISSAFLGFGTGIASAFLRYTSARRFPKWSVISR